MKPIIFFKKRNLCLSLFLSLSSLRKKRKEKKKILKDTHINYMMYLLSVLIFDECLKIKIPIFDANASSSARNPAKIIKLSQKRWN